MMKKQFCLLMLPFSKMIAHERVFEQISRVRQSVLRGNFCCGWGFTYQWFEVTKVLWQELGRDECAQLHYAEVLVIES